MSEEDTTSRARKTLLGMVIGAAVTAVFPPAGIALGAAGVLGSARKYAQSGEPVDALGMVTGSDDLSSSESDD